MAGHSHWARIKRAKAVTDARRGKAWSKLSRAIIVAARNGGPDPSANLSLRYAIDAARAENMPKDTIERAIKKGSGEAGTESFAELAYEGFGPGGVAVLCSALTDNRNRTGPEIKKIFERAGGSLGGSGSVAWMFAQRGVVLISASAASEETVTNVALECGADDVVPSGDGFEIRCEPGVLEILRQELAKRKIDTVSAELAMLPSSQMRVEGEIAERLLRMVDELEEHDDVQRVFTNVELSESDLNRLADA